VRRALDVKEGDYLEAEVVAEGVLLRPVAVVDREAAWRGIEHAVSQVRDLMTRPRDDNQAEEEKISLMVKEHRRGKARRA
jgi:hypothetical protein